MKHMLLGNFSQLTLLKFSEVIALSLLSYEFEHLSGKKEHMKKMELARIHFLRVVRGY
jgi:hypothetical protein